MNRLPCFVTFLLLVHCGCGSGSSYKVAQVSGTVTFKAKPLANAHVSFAPSGSQEPGPASYGKTDAAGKYKLRLETTDQEGAVVGPHVVRISTLGNAGEQADAGKPLKDDIPAKYNTNSTLTFTVPRSGTQEANFDLLP